MTFPEPTAPASSRTEVFLTYLDHYRSVVVDTVAALPHDDQRRSRLSSGWTPIELVRHLTHVERRWLEWGFEDADLPDPWGDHRDGRWYVAPQEPPTDLLAALRERGARTRAIVEARTLTDVGLPSDRWGGAPPATLERVLFHLLQEYARHTGHLDVVAELAGVTTQE